MAGIFSWKLHGNGKTLGAGEVVAPDERLSWLRTTGIGLQHIVAMFGATFTVPLITEFSPSTTLFFSAIATMLFLLITRNRVPSYLGSSFAFIAPIQAAMAGGSMAVAVFGILVTGILLTLIGLLVTRVGTRWIHALMPPVVLGTIVALIGFNLAPTTLGGFSAAPVTATVTVTAIILIMALLKGIIGRISILLGVAIGYCYAVFAGEVNFAPIEEAAWFGLPDFVTPVADWSILPMFLPIVLVLIAENIGHIKSVSLMTKRNLDKSVGWALMADGLGTTLAGVGGGSGTTTYAENIGVMAATRVYSTAAYWVAGLGALLLSLCPKFGAAIFTVPGGVLAGACMLLYGMIGMLGVRIWVENRVDFGKPVNLMTAAVPLVIAIAGYSIGFGEVVDGTGLTVLNEATGSPVQAVVFNGICLATVATLVIYHLVRALNRLRGIDLDAAEPLAINSQQDKPE